MWDLQDALSPMEKLKGPMRCLIWYRHWGHLYPVDPRLAGGQTRKITSIQRGWILSRIIGKNASVYVCDFQGCSHWIWWRVRQQIRLDHFRYGSWKQGAVISWFEEFFPKKHSKEVANNWWHIHQYEYEYDTLFMCNIISVQVDI